MNHVARMLSGLAVICLTIGAPIRAQPVADHQVQIFGQKIHYLEAGSGEPPDGWENCRCQPGWTGSGPDGPFSIMVLV